MLRKLTCLVILTGGCALLLAAPMHAQKEKQVEKSDDEISAERMQKLSMAYELAEQGRKKNAPEYLITAAGMLRRLSAYRSLQVAKPFDGKLDTEDALAAKEVKAPSLLEQSDEIFREASDMGATLGANVDKLIKIAKERETNDKEERAVVGGPKQINKQIGPGKVHSYTYKLYTGAYSQWFFRSISPLNVSVVHAENFNPMYWKYTTFASRVWHPNWHPNPKVKQATVVIRIQNPSKQPSQYQMMIQ